MQGVYIFGENYLMAAPYGSNWCDKIAHSMFLAFTSFNFAFGCFECIGR